MSVVASSSGGTSTVAGASGSNAALSNSGSGGSSRGRELSAEFLGELKKAFSKNIIKSADMNHELMSEATDLIVSAIDKQRGNYEVKAQTNNGAMTNRTKRQRRWHMETFF
jgi:FMN-dependent NADH-azoreductase